MEICVCAHLTQTRDALEKCAEMGINMKIQIQKRKLAVSSILSFILTFLQIAGWQLSMNYGSSMHRSVLLQRIGVLKVWQCLLWGILEWILLDVFFYVTFTFLENRERVEIRAHKEGRFFWAVTFLLLFSIWMFFLWCCYPGYNNYDVENQLVQVMYDTIPYSSHHPLLHTLFCGGLITLGYKIDDSSLSLGLFLVNTVQIFILAGCMTCSLKYILKKTKRKGLFLFSFCFYAFCPVVVMFAMSPTKDVLCYAFLLMAFLQLNELYSILEEAGRAAFRNWFMPGVFLTLSCLMRKNVVYGVVVFGISSLLLFSRKRVKQLFLFAGVVVSCILINKGLLLALDAEPGEVDEALCVPYQQIARLYVEKGEDAFTEEEYQLLGRVVPPENLLCYDPVMADGIKANFSQGLPVLLENKGEYLRFWLKKGMQYPGVYLSSLLYNTYQAWYPWTITMDKTGVRYFDTTWNDENGAPGNPNLYEFYREIRWGKYADWIGVRLLFSTGTMVWLVLVAWFYCIWKKEKPAILGFLLIILVCSTNLLGPVSDVRYYLILFYLLPICLAVLSAGKS